MRVHTDKEEIRTLGILDDRIYTGSTEGKISIIQINETGELSLLQTVRSVECGQLKCMNNNHLIWGSGRGHLIQFDGENLKGIKLLDENIACLSIYGKYIATTSWDRTLRIWEANLDDITNGSFSQVWNYSDIGIWCMQSVKVNLKYYDELETHDCLIFADYNGKFHVYNNGSVFFSAVIHNSCVRSFALEQQEIIFETKEFCDDSNLVKNLTRAIKTVTMVSVSNCGQIMRHTLSKIFKHDDLKTMSYKVLISEENISCLCGEGSVYIFDSKLENMSFLETNNPTIWDGGIFGNKYLIAGGSSGYLDVIDLDTKKLVSEKCSDDELIEHEQYNIKGNKIYSKSGEYIGEKVPRTARNQFIHSPPEHKSFSIDVGGTQLPISFTTDEKPEAVAARFLINHGLSMTYQQEIVSFINKHFKKNSTTFLGVELVTGINIQAIKSRLENFDSQMIFELLARCSRDDQFLSVNLKEIDDANVIECASTTLKEIYMKMTPGERYPIIDIVRYLALFDGIHIDFLYFTDIYNDFSTIKGSKEQEALLRLIINLYPRKFLYMEIFHKFLKGLNMQSASFDKYMIIRDKFISELKHY